MPEISEESSRCLHCKNPLCRTGCPVGYDIPEFLSLVKCGETAAATATVGHLFGEVCGYICPHELQCKGHCVLNKRGAPIDVGDVERQVFAQNFPKLVRQNTVLVGRKIAVIGGGVSGVTFAAECYRNGADVSIFERAELLHTLKSIPDFRLPRKSLQRIVDTIENSDIHIIKQNVSASDLRQICKDFDVVYIATGVSVPHKMGIVGEEFATLADDFLRGNTFGDVIIVGGGNTAMDCARLNARHGCKTIVAYRRSRADMPAFSKEVENAARENVEFKFNLAPISVEKGVDGKLSVTFAETISEGRGKLVLTDRRITLECQILVLALGSGYDNSVFDAERFLQVDDENRLSGNIFAGGDATGKSLAAQAVADGLRAASAAKRALAQNQN